MPLQDRHHRIIQFDGRHRLGPGPISDRQTNWDQIPLAQLWKLGIAKQDCDTATRLEDQTEQKPANRITKTFVDTQEAFTGWADPVVAVSSQVECSQPPKDPQSRRVLTVLNSDLRPKSTALNHLRPPPSAPGATILASLAPTCSRLRHQPKENSPYGTQ
ncbi:hypothetical protein Cob_v001117 [Colletotrichum orbiculare MAFF 240422]|uniref:Uncharacterized protein n=1 Tax=Colletotrichum orbiculare (strain 104-T / ATCC 96160 / CBS 514.97 / LARS 414 / MAFF 240422) TaxID=1213857 RepID=A0A484G7D0_COLOR|nr:hypothetical protein Cob_v001117 [Colletotrichum orbiculare MAFF 240422]